MAHFEEDGSWYTADDQGDRPRVVQRAPGTEHEMPVVIFLERVGSRAARAAARPWPPGRVDAEGVGGAEGAGDGGDVGSGGEDSPGLDGDGEGEDGASDGGPRGAR